MKPSAKKWLKLPSRKNSKSSSKSSASLNTSSIPQSGTTVSISISDQSIDPSMDPILIDKKVKKLRQYIAKLDNRLVLYQTKLERLSDISDDEKQLIKKGLTYFNESTKNESAV